MVPVNPAKCKTCIFRRDGNQVALSPFRWAEIQEYLIQGTPHLCHSKEGTACRGGRDFQLTIWQRLGIIPEATDEALEGEMRKMGFS